MKLAALLFVCSMAYCQTADNERLVTVPQKYVSSEGLQHQQTPEISKWKDFGREIGIATKEGLEAVVNTAEKFGTTKVGTFVMFMIAWKIIGKTILAIVIGIPIWIAGTALWVWSYRRFFIGVRVLDSFNVESKVKTYKTSVYQFNNSKDGKVAVGVVHVLFLLLWNLVWILTIFA